MFRRACLIGTLAVLVIAPALWAQNDDKDKPKQDKPGTPAEEFSALVKEYQTAQQEFNKARVAAKTAEERQELAKLAPKAAEFAGKFLDIAEKNPKDPVAVDALIWVLNTGATTPQGRKAAKKLVEDHPASEKIGQAVMQLAQQPDAEKSLRTILEKNQNRQVRAIASYGLGRSLIVKSLNAEEGKDEEARKLAEEARPLFQEILDKYLDVQGPGGNMFDMTLQLLPYVPGAADLVRDLLKKDLAHDVKGKATFGLAQVLKGESEKAGTVAASKEAESVLQEVIDNFADVRGARGTLADAAKPVLVEIQKRGVGKTAPDIEAEDVGGETFKLSDYRGKVVFLDFWGHW